MTIGAPRVRYHRTDIVERALELLDDYGLADLSMRRLAGELGVQPSALYHHFDSKQVLLAAVAEEILARGAGPVTAAAWDEAAVQVCHQLRDTLLAYRDGVEIVATVHAFGLGAAGPEITLRELLATAGLPTELTRAGARALLHFVFGSAADDQLHLQASSAGAIADDPRQHDDFRLGLELLMDGLRTRRAQLTWR